METLSKQRKAQLLAAPYLHLLAENELSLSRLYTCLSAMLPGAKKFWKKMAQEEIDHAEILQELAVWLEHEEWKFIKAELGYAKIYESIAWIESKRNAIEEYGITMHEALDIAHYLENSMIDSDLFKAIKVKSKDVRREFQVLLDETDKHRHSIEDEAKKLKWKIRGDRKSGPAHSSGHNHAESQSDAIKHQQEDIVKGLIRLEESASILYGTYSFLYENLREFWAKMSLEEEQHASMLRKLLEMQDKGVLFYHLGRFNIDELQKEIHYAITSAEDAMADMFDLHEAIRRAFCVEKSMSESMFYKVVDSDSEAFKILAHRLADLTREHVKKMDALLISGEY